MKNLIKWLILALLLVAVIVAAVLLYNKYSEEYSAEIPEENTIPAPDFTVFDNEGNAVKLSDFKGKPVVLNFWATWCHYCKEGLPGFENLYKKHPEVQFLMVNATDGVQETETAARKYIKEKGYTFNVYYDTRMSASTAYGVTGLPNTYFINAEGEVVARAGGYIDESTLEKGINMIMEQNNGN